MEYMGTTAANPDYKVIYMLMESESLLKFKMFVTHGPLVARFSEI